MTPHDYLVAALQNQELSTRQVQELRDLRERIEAWFRGQFGYQVRMYYAGSYGKQTMVRAAYDLDLVLYFPPTERATLHDIFWSVNRRLIDGGYNVVPRTVALRLPYTAEFHVDIVPGRAQDNAFRYATLYKNTAQPSTLQTSLKVHIESVKNAGLSNHVRLMKLWRIKRRLAISTFAIEVITARAMYGERRGDYAAGLLTIFRWIVANLESASLQDPANTNNIIDVSYSDRLATVWAAREAIAAPSWSDIV
jgi:hypothetical protein